MKFKKFTENEKKQMAADYANGDGLKVLADRFGVSVPTMAKYVRAGGGTVRKPGTVRVGNGDFVKTVEANNVALTHPVNGGCSCVAQSGAVVTVTDNQGTSVSRSLTT